MDGMNMEKRTGNSMESIFIQRLKGIITNIMV